MTLGTQLLPGGILELAIIGALLWGLWFVFRQSRGRAKRIAAQLAEPIEPKHDLVLVRRRRKSAAIWAVVSAWLGLSLAVNVGRSHAILGVGVALVFVLSVVGYTRMAVQRSPVLELDGEGMRIPASSTSVRWSSVEDVWIEERRSHMGVSHYSLNCDYYPESSEAHRSSGLATLKLPLVELVMSWTDLAVAVRDRWGQEVRVVKPNQDNWQRSRNVSSRRCLSCDAMRCGMWWGHAGARGHSGGRLRSSISERGACAARGYAEVSTGAQPHHRR